MTNQRFLARLNSSSPLRPRHWVKTVLVSATCGALLLAPVIFSPAALADEISRILTVSGRGRVAVETAIATVRLGVSVEGESVQAVQAEVAERSDRVISKLQELGVSRLQTAGISLYPEYRSRDGEARVVRVRGQNTVTFEVPVAETGAVLDEAVATGASRIDSISFRPTDEDALAGRDEAIRLAVQDAMVQAEVTLEALGLEMAGIREVQVNSGGNNPVPVANYEASVLRSSDVATPVLGGERTVEATVTVTVDY